ncbi:MAG: AsmA family protein [Deltaproteobacteria bacterium]|nr:AsmA family protein [Deltaproteobacteria bacterium]
MNRTVKWLLIIGVSLIAVFITALVLLPKLVDVKQYKPRIEAQVTKATGRTFSIGDDLRLSLFPYASLSFSDLHLGSLPGFKEKDFVIVKSFDVRVKLLPLLFKDIQVKRFILKGTRLVLETGKDGRTNWEFSAKTTPELSGKTPKETQKPRKAESGEGLALKAFTLGEFAVTDGSVLWLDHKKKERKEISDVTLLLQDVSLDRPIGVTFSARLDKQPFSLKGNVGPMGKTLGKGTIPLDLSVRAFEQVDVTLKGNVMDPASRLKFDININVSPFSLRKILAAMGKALPESISDPKAVNRISLKAGIKGDAKHISVSDGVLDMDESKVDFMIKAGSLAKPQVAFNVNIDQVDLDRYLPPAGQKESGEKEAKTAEPKGAKKTDYSKLRRLSLNGTMRIGKLKIKNAKIERLHLTLTGEKGIFNLQPLTMGLYQGDASGSGMFSVQNDVPRTNIQLKLNNVQAGPLLMDVLKKDFLEGMMKAQVNLNLKGDDAVAIKRTLNGNGDLLFKDGAIKGVDLDGMIHNAKAAFGLAEKGEKTPRTDFSQLHVPFSVKNGLVNTVNTALISPLIRLTASGNADLIEELLDFRLEPKLVGTLKGQGDTKDRSGLMVAVLVAGSFSSPEFRPDFEGMLKKEIGKSLPGIQDKLLGTDSKKEESGSVEEQIKGILKGFGK